MSLWFWVGFLALVLALLALDLGVFNRKAHAVSIREALLWTAFWVSLALVFNVFIYFAYHYHWLGMGTAAVGGELNSGGEAALKFFTGYVIEKSLSLDNIFIIALIFGYFSVPPQFQHRTLFWGILGALVMRGAMILAGLELLHRFEWMIYVFGGLLVATALRMMTSGHESLEPESTWAVKLARRFYPVTGEYHGQRFFVNLDGRRHMTPLFLVLLMIESTDLLFAVDSIPAIFAITRDPFLVFTSNVFAILGLRSLYFALAGMIVKFRYLKPSLVFLLAYVGVKMLVSHHIHIPVLLSLGIIVGILTVGVVASVLGKPLPEPLLHEAMDVDPEETPVLPPAVRDAAEADEQRD